MKKKMQNYFIWGVGAVIAIMLIALVVADSKKPSALDGFAECLGEQGATFYGAFWCPHCQNQKKLFGNAEKKLPYTECSTTNGQGQLPVCQEAGIESYPTWTFADGSRMTGEISLSELSKKTGCELPASY